MSTKDFDTLLAGIREGQIIPYLGPGALEGACDAETRPIPADSDSLILAMNGGPMAPRLMYEFPRAAMHLELKRGRSFVTRFLTELYGGREWSRSPLHEWLAIIKPPYVIDINRDTQLQASYRDLAHTLVTGIARTAGTDYRFKLFHNDGAKYRPIELEAVDPRLPVLFKPMGTPDPEPNFIASDADYVDYITELMGGFAIPAFLKDYRKGRQYLFLGLRMTRDTERMVLSDVSYDAGEPRGWALIPEPTDKEKRFCDRQKIEIIQADIPTLLEVDGFSRLERRASDSAPA
ncbi:MAG: SIR2 family protein [Methylohalobius crimeensis]